MLYFNKIYIHFYRNFNEEEKEKAIKIIKSNANSILFKLNKELDISSLDASKIKVFNDEYDVYILFKSIQEITENLIKSKNVDLKFYVDKNSGKIYKIKY